MIKDTISKHDFISGEPRKDFTFGDYDFSNVRLTPSANWGTNPCGEVSLGAFQTGELGVVLSPPSTGNSMMYETLRSSLDEIRHTFSVDYASLYPTTFRDIQITNNTTPTTSYTDVTTASGEWTIID